MEFESATGPESSARHKCEVRVVNERRIGRVRLSDMPQDRSGDEQATKEGQRTVYARPRQQTATTEVSSAKTTSKKTDFTDTAGLLQRQSPFLVRTDLESDHTLAPYNPREKTENPIICLSPNK